MHLRQLVAQCGSVLGLRAAKGLSRRFQHGSSMSDSGTNLIKQGEIVTVRSCGPKAQWSNYSHGLRGVLGSSPGRAMCFFLPCDSYIVCRISRLLENCYTDVRSTGTRSVIAIGYGKTIIFKRNDHFINFIL